MYPSMVVSKTYIVACHYSLRFFKNKVAISTSHVHSMLFSIQNVIMLVHYETCKQDLAITKIHYEFLYIHVHIIHMIWHVKVLSYSKLTTSLNSFYNFLPIFLKEDHPVLISKFRAHFVLLLKYEEKE